MLNCITGSFSKPSEDRYHLYVWTIQNQLLIHQQFETRRIAQRTFNSMKKLYDSHQSFGRIILHQHNIPLEFESRLECAQQLKLPRIDPLFQETLTSRGIDAGVELTQIVRRRPVKVNKSVRPERVPTPPIFLTENKCGKRQAATHNSKANSLNARDTAYSKYEKAYLLPIEEMPETLRLTQSAPLCFSHQQTPRSSLDETMERAGIFDNCPKVDLEKIDNLSLIEKVDDESKNKISTFGNFQGSKKSQRESNETSYSEYNYRFGK